MNANIRRNMKAVELLVRKYSPEILTVVGVVAGVAGAVVACKKTLEVKGNLDEVSTAIADLKDDAEDENLPVDKKELTKLYAKGAVVVAKTYAPAIILETTSVVCVLAAAGILKKRNAGLAAAYATLDNLFKEYRQNVIEDVGEAKDYDYFNSLKTVKVKEKVVDPETGKEKTVTKEEKVSTRKDGTFSIIFGPGNRNYKGVPTLDRAFLKGIEEWANDQTYLDGHIFMDKIYEAIGEEEPPEAHTHGYLYDGTTHQINFGIFDTINDRVNEGIKNNDPNGENVFVITFTPPEYILDNFHSVKGAR